MGPGRWCSVLEIACSPSSGRALSGQAPGTSAGSGGEGRRAHRGQPTPLLPWRQAACTRAPSLSRPPHPRVQHTHPELPLRPSPGRSAHLPAPAPPVKRRSKQQGLLTNCMQYRQCWHHHSSGSQARHASLPTSARPATVTDSAAPAPAAKASAAAEQPRTPCGRSTRSGSWCGASSSSRWFWTCGRGLRGEAVEG